MEGRRLMEDGRRLIDLEIPRDLRLMGDFRRLVVRLLLINPNSLI